MYLPDYCLKDEAVTKQKFLSLKVELSLLTLHLLENMIKPVYVFMLTYLSPDHRRRHDSLFSI